MKKHLHLKKVLVALLTIVAVMVGHQAMAASKTVTYTFTVAFDSSNPNRCTLTFTPSNSGFGYSTGRKTVTILDVSSTTGFTVQLDDGLQLTYSQDQGRMTFGDYNSINLNWPNTGGNSRLTLGSSHYYVTHVKLAMPNGNNVLVGQAIPWTGANAQLDVDVDMVTETDGLVNFRTFSATFSDPQVFGQFTVTYGDSPRDYTITYNDAVNGQNGVTNNNPTTYKVTTNTFSVTAPTRTGYDFVRFTYTDAQQSNPIQPTLPHVISRGDAATRKAITFNAQWTPNTYTVTLDNQSATNPGTASVTATYDAAMPAITVPTKTGYTFGGYYTATNGGGTQYYNADGTSAHNWDIASETTLYAQWTANTYTVTLDNQSATNPGTTSVTATYDAAMPAITVPTKTGYTFGGYYTETNGGGTKYYNANGTSAHNWDIASATTLYAQWNVIPWTGGGTTENDPFVILYASQLIKLSNDVNGGNKYNGNFFKLGNDIDMSGVAFDGIGNSISRCFRGTFDGDGKIVSNVIVNRSEYENVGFFGYVSSGGAVKNLILDGVSIAGDQRVGVLVGYGYYCSIENCLVMNSSVTSNWSYRGVICGKPDEATLNGNHYRNCTCNNTQTTNIGVGNFGSTDVDGARSVHTLTLPEQVSVASATESVTYDEVTYYASTSTVTFNYNDVPDGYMPTYSATAGTVSGNTLTMPAEDVTITVSLVAITYNIAYDLAGGSVATANPNTYNIETETFTLNNPTREGYTFAGWTGTDLDEQTMTVTIAQGSTGDRSYTATWSTDAYTITYDLAGGSVATANPTTYTVETPTFTLNNPTKVACNFDGWTGSNGDTPETTVTIAQGSTGDRSYTAQWTQYAFTLSLGTDITASGTVAFTYEGTDYYAVGTEITLAYGGTIPEGYRPLYSVNGNAIVGNTFEMPTADVVVDAVLLERYYTFNSTTGVLALLWGEFNRYNKWGSEVTESAVTSVTATDEVSFTGDCYQLFYNFTSCTSMDLTDVNTANVTNMQYMFYGCSDLQSLNVSGWNTANVTKMSYMFRNCSGLPSLDLSGWNTANVTNMSYMFRNCSGLQSLDLSDWSTANVTNMSSMFDGCSVLQSLNVSGWNTANVTNMSYMFFSCSGLPSLDLSDWSTANVTDMKYMFYGCSDLQSLNISGWNTANVTDMKYMFYGCSGLQSLNISGWNTANVTNMSHMFDFCRGLQSLNISGWNTAKVTNISHMFRNCSGLQSLDLSGWNTANVSDMSYMFQYCTNLVTIYVGEGWNTIHVDIQHSSNMFTNCTSLVGGMGTAYDANHIDKEYARIDGGPDNPGYFTGRFTKEIAGYGNDENPGGYYLIASPVGTVNPENVGNMTANAFDLYRFNQSADLEWENWKDQDDGGYDLVSGKGYLYANSDDVTLTFTGTPVEGDTYEVTLTRDDNAEFAGWNLVGNPFTKTAYIMGDVAFYTMNEAGSELEACTSLTSIAPMEGVFVLANTDGETLTFTTEEPSKKGEMMAINLCGGGVSTLRQAQGPRTAILDRAIVRFDDGGVLPKLQIRKDNTKVYIPMDGKEYAVVNMGRDAARHVSTIDVNFKAAENGEYTIAVNAEGVMFNYLHLIDNITGTDVDLLHPNAVIAGEDPQSPTPAMTTEGKGYTFTAKTTDYESRFRLVFSTSGDANGDNEAFAFVDASGNIIITDGPSTGSGACTLQVIDMMGRVIFSRDAARHVSTSGMTPGVYVLRLINGDTIRTQKIVID